MSSIIPGGWELASLLCKLLLYFATASVAGGSFCLWQFSDGRRQSVRHLLLYIMLGAFVGFQAVLLSFLVQVGQLSGTGLGGMLDWGMASILLDTSLGEVTFLRLAAFVYVLLATLLFLRQVQNSQKPLTQQAYLRFASVYLAPVMLLAFTFRLSGHVSVLALSGQVAIILHVIAFALWIGSLYPLLRLTYTPDAVALRYWMKRFGDFAMGIVACLAGAGVLLAWQLLASVEELVTTAYGLALLLKLLLVLVLLAIAGLNKLYLVPRLEQAGGAAALARSIRMEILAATLILTVTAYFSTVVGPA